MLERVGEESIVILAHTLSEAALHDSTLTFAGGFSLYSEGKKCPCDVLLLETAMEVNPEGTTLKLV